MPPADTWPPQLLTSCSLALGCVAELCWTSPQRLSGDWFLLHCGILSQYFSILPSLLCWEDWGQGEGSVSASLDKPGLLWLKAQLHHLVVGVLLSADHCTPGTSWAHSFRDLCPLRPFSCLLFLPVPAWSLLRSRNRVIYLGTAQSNAQASSRAWQNWNLKIALRQSALFPC